ncbi:hypothetical protein GCM10009733_024180 [Nonomuraea maheshkhaliensis]|uniref:AAA+ ATPase domain-containing protein n=1 Tax=Nonomuraea maheshkhaliensis TaxID=419590 RepID=A0ABN2F2J7_9ACTN
MARLADRLNAARTATFTGRATHLAAFRDALAGGPAAVLFVHGPGGVGKTSLLRRYADEARRAGRHVIAIDGRDLPASPSAFSSAAAAALNDPTVVLLIDDFERCQGLEGWLSGTFLPRLPATALTVIAGRNPPARRWSDDPGWAQALRVLPMGNLGEQEARNMLLAAGVAAQRHEEILRFTGGHPLALSMAAKLATGPATGPGSGPGGGPGGGGGAGQEPPGDWQPGDDVLRHLLERLIGEVPTPAHRRTLEVCAHVLDTTQALLQVAAPGQAEELFTWLRDQPYIVAGRHGLHPHDLIRRLLDADLRWRDPDGYQEMHTRMRAHLIQRARAASGPAVLPATLALSFLHRHNGFVSRFITWGIPVACTRMCCVPTIGPPYSGSSGRPRARARPPSPDSGSTGSRPASAYTDRPAANRSPCWPGYGWRPSDPRRSTPTRSWPPRGCTRAPAVPRAGASTSASPASWWTRPGISGLPPSWTL